MWQKRRKVTPLQIGERKQYAPGVLGDKLHPALRQNITKVAVIAQVQSIHPARGKY
jgi:hypothetical protein